MPLAMPRAVSNAALWADAFEEHERALLRIEPGGPELVVADLVRRISRLDVGVLEDAQLECARDPGATERDHHPHQRDKPGTAREIAATMDARSGRGSSMKLQRSFASEGDATCTSTLPASWRCGVRR